MALLPSFPTCTSPPQPQENDTTGQTAGGSEVGEGVTDVIQQLLELSEQVSGETAQPQPSEPAITMETAINQDILQVSDIQHQCNTERGLKRWLIWMLKQLTQFKK